MTLPFKDPIGSSLSVLGIIALSLMSSGCYSDPEDFNRRLAEILCEKAKYECTPMRFAVSCQAACNANSDCASGRCNQLTHICRDDDGPLSIDRLNEPCSNDAECGGGLLCVQRYASEAACVTEVEERWQAYSNACDYNKSYARECIDATETRSCGEDQDPVCGDVYYNCVF